jgi:exonuclease III
MHSRHVLIGDFNIGLKSDCQGSTLTFSDKFNEFFDTYGWKDLWRSRNEATEYSWYSAAGNGFRIDHAIGSPDLLPVQDCKYSHREREEKLSDHSMLLLQI